MIITIIIIMTIRIPTMTSTFPFKIRQNSAGLSYVQLLLMEEVA
jgi:hypothetical protein